MTYSSSDPTTHRTIPPEKVAAKLAAIGNHECPSASDIISRYPRFLELLLFIQAPRPGGPFKLAQDFLAAFRNQIGTPAMREAKGRNYSVEQKLTICHEMPSYERPALPEQTSGWQEILSNSTPAELRALREEERRALESALGEITAETLTEICERSAAKHLPSHLVRLCTEVNSRIDSDGELARSLDDDTAESWQGTHGETWYFDNLIGALIVYMNGHATKELEQFPSTAVAREVLETMDRARETGVSMMLRGDPRTGKTESAKSKCRAQPGRFRFVAVPEGNSLRELLFRIAEGLGIETSYGTASGPLRSKIQYILDHTGLTLFFDEGAWLLPESYSKTTQPVRLNWIRSSILDRGLPAIIGVTPQWFDGPLKAFIDATKYVMEQFTGRCETIALPGVLSDEDVALVAAFHFPEVRRRADLVEIASYAPASDSYLKAIELISKRARYTASQRNVPLSIEIIREAAERISHGGQPKADGEAAPVGTGLMDGSRRLKAPLNAHSRAVKPAQSAPVSGADLQSSSLRGAGPVRVETELVSAET